MQSISRFEETFVGKPECFKQDQWSWDPLDSSVWVPQKLRSPVLLNVAVVGCEASLLANRVENR